MDFGVRRDPPCSDCDRDGHCTMNCGPALPARTHEKDLIGTTVFNETMPLLVIPNEATLRASLARMTAAFRPFTLRPIGGEGSQARMEQDEQIAAHAEAMKLLG